VKVWLKLLKPEALNGGLYSSSSSETCSEKLLNGNIHSSVGRDARDILGLKDVLGVNSICGRYIE
jgi:hypothetical protein